VSTEFLNHLTALQVPIFTARPAPAMASSGARQLAVATPDSNGVRLDARRPGDALGGVMGGNVAVIDVDTKNGGDPAGPGRRLTPSTSGSTPTSSPPSGGRHYYVAGHPDLPTVHATAGRDGLVGYPGVEIISFGANVFLPRTERPKYDGPGTSSSTTTSRPSPTVATRKAGSRWRSGSQTTAPVRRRCRCPQRLGTARHRTHARRPTWRPFLDRQATQVASMGPNTGRNVALYTAAVICGSFIAGAGMDEQNVVDRLREAADRCGLTAEDGPRSVPRRSRQA
jgi:hypothetical protein